VSAGSAPTTTAGGGPEPVPAHEADPHPDPAGPDPDGQRRPPPASVPSAGTLNTPATPPQDIQAQIAAENALLRIPYGRVSIGAQIADVIFVGRSSRGHRGVGRGRRRGIDAIEQVYLDDKIRLGQHHGHELTRHAGRGRRVTS
jgi:hypothetical protein